MRGQFAGAIVLALFSGAQADTTVTAEGTLTLAIFLDSLPNSTDASVLASICTPPMLSTLGVLVAQVFSSPSTPSVSIVPGGVSTQLGRRRLDAAREGAEEDEDGARRVQDLVDMHVDVTFVLSFPSSVQPYPTESSVDAALAQTCSSEASTPSKAAVQDAAAIVFEAALGQTVDRVAFSGTCILVTGVILTTGASAELQVSLGTSPSETNPSVLAVFARSAALTALQGIVTDAFPSPNTPDVSVKSSSGGLSASAAVSRRRRLEGNEGAPFVKGRQLAGVGAGGLLRLFYVFDLVYPVASTAPAASAMANSLLAEAINPPNGVISELMASLSSALGAAVSSAGFVSIGPLPSAAPLAGAPLSATSVVCALPAADAATRTFLASVGSPVAGCTSYFYSCGQQCSLVAVPAGSACLVSIGAVVTSPDSRCAFAALFPTASISPSTSATGSKTRSSSPSASLAATSSPTGSRASSASATQASTASQGPTPGASVSQVQTLSRSGTRSGSQSLSATQSPSRTYTSLSTPSSTLSPAQTASPSYSPSATFSPAVSRIVVSPLPGTSVTAKGALTLAIFLESLPNTTDRGLLAAYSAPPTLSTLGVLVSQVFPAPATPGVSIVPGSLSTRLVARRLAADVQGVRRAQALVDLHVDVTFALSFPSNLWPYPTESAVDIALAQTCSSEASTPSKDAVLSAAATAFTAALGDTVIYAAFSGTCALVSGVILTTGASGALTATLGALPSETNATVLAALALPAALTALQSDMADAFPAPTTPDVTIRSSSAVLTSGAAASRRRRLGENEGAPFVTRRQLAGAGAGGLLRLFYVFDLAFPVASNAPAASAIASSLSAEAASPANGTATALAASLGSALGVPVSSAGFASIGPLPSAAPLAGASLTSNAIVCALPAADAATRSFLVSVGAPVAGCTSFYYLCGLQCTLVAVPTGSACLVSGGTLVNAANARCALAVVLPTASMSPTPSASPVALSSSSSSSPTRSQSILASVSPSGSWTSSASLSPSAPPTTAASATCNGTLCISGGGSVGASSGSSAQGSPANAFEAQLGLYVAVIVIGVVAIVTIAGIVLLCCCRSAPEKEPPPPVDAKRRAGGAGKVGSPRVDVDAMELGPWRPGADAAAAPPPLMPAARGRSVRHSVAHAMSPLAVEGDPTAPISQPGAVGDDAVVLPRARGAGYRSELPPGPGAAAGSMRQVHRGEPPRRSGVGGTPRQAPVAGPPPPSPGEQPTKRGVIGATLLRGPPAPNAASPPPLPPFAAPASQQPLSPHRALVSLQPPRLSGMGPPPWDGASGASPPPPRQQPTGPMARQSLRAAATPVMVATPGGPVWPQVGRPAAGSVRAISLSGRVPPGYAVPAAVERSGGNPSQSPGPTQGGRRVSTAQRQA